MTTATATTRPARSRRSRVLGVLQRIGLSLMLPIAVLPAAGLLLRFGQPDMLGRFSALSGLAKVMAAGGGALLNNLPLLFAVGVSIGFAKKSDGTTALSALVGYLVFDSVTRGMFAGSSIRDQVINVQTGALDLSLPNPTGVLGGILIGITAALLWQRYSRIKLPSWLAFFGGRRFEPIATAFVALVIGVLFGWLWAPIGTGLNDFGNWLASNGTIGSGIYGSANRLLIPLGLHHIINSIVWFNVGDCTAPNGAKYTGDINCFLHQGVYVNGTRSGIFQTGFFPVIMFGLPAAALAMAHEARGSAKKKAVSGVMISAALTSFITGVTEPIEFSFIFIAPVLYGIHVVLTGISMALTTALGIRDGFSFSAGLIDYLVNFNIATRPLLLIPIGVVYAIVYYTVFRVVIRKFDLLTPGRELDDELADGMSGPQIIDENQLAEASAKANKTGSSTSG